MLPVQLLLPLLLPLLLLHAPVLSLLLLFAGRFCPRWGLNCECRNGLWQQQQQQQQREDGRAPWSASVSSSAQ
jgi:hypothetical protein